MQRLRLLLWILAPVMRVPPGAMPACLIQLLVRVLEKQQVRTQILEFLPRGRSDSWLSPGPASAIAAIGGGRGGEGNQYFKNVSLCVSHFNSPVPLHFN